MEALDKLVKDGLDSTGRPQFIRYVSIYMLIIGVLGLCGGVALVFLGGVAGLGGALGAATLSQSTSPDAQEAAQAAGALVGVSGLLLVFGVLSLLSGPAMFVVGMGLRNKASWSRMGVVIVGGIHALVSLIGLFTGGGIGGGIGNILWIVGDAFIVYAFYSDAGIKAELGG